MFSTSLSHLGKKLIWLTGLFCAAIYAEEPILTHNFSPTQANQASWVFSGVVTNEEGDNYGYFFQMQRNYDHFHSVVAVFNGQNNQLIMQDESEAIIQDPLSYRWQVGRAFLRFNPINDSWVFGLKSKDNKGFNFKVDLLQASENVPVAQDLRPGVELIVAQTSHLNGHVQIGNGSSDQFVTSKNAWFRQLWVASPQNKEHSFTGVLCRFNDGSGFYSANMIASDALRGAVAGWSNAEGVPGVVSQFITVKQTAAGPWHILIPSPNRHLVLSDFVQQSSVVAGFVTKSKTPAFCMLSKDIIGEQHKSVS